MKKFEDIPLEHQAIRVYALSLLVSLITSPLFGRLYIEIFNPPIFGDFYTINDPYFLLDGTLFSFYLFLSLFTFWLIVKKQWFVWSIGIFIPILLALAGGIKDFTWAILLSFIGWFIAQIILKINKKNDL